MDYKIATIIRDTAIYKLEREATDYGIKCGTKAINAAFTRAIKENDMNILMSAYDRMKRKYCIKGEQ